MVQQTSVVLRCLHREPEWLMGSTLEKVCEALVGIRNRGHLEDLLVAELMQKGPPLFLLFSPSVHPGPA